MPARNHVTHLVLRTLTVQECDGEGQAGDCWSTYLQTRDTDIQEKKDERY